MRLDHIAYRVKDRDAAVKFFKEAFGYTEQAEFDLKLEDGSTARCMALEPPEKQQVALPQFVSDGFHLAPEIFVSSGPPGSLIDRWVNEWGRGVGAIHHLAYQVEDVPATMREWLDKGLMFTTDGPLECPNLTQIFSQPHPLTGIIYEFIARTGNHGFCKENVAKLMSSTAKLA